MEEGLDLDGSAFQGADVTVDEGVEPPPDVHPSSAEAPFAG